MYAETIVHDVARITVLETCEISESSWRKQSILLVTKDGFVHRVTAYLDPKCEPLKDQS